MASKEQTYNNDKASSKQWSPKPVTENLDIVAQQQTHSATIIQRAKLDPNLLTPHEMQQLQQTVGNQVVGQLLAQTAKHQPIQEKENKTGLPDDLKTWVPQHVTYRTPGTQLHQMSSSVVQRRKHTPEEVKKALEDGTIKSYIAAVYRLEYRHHNDDIIYLSAPAQQHDYCQASNAKYWYRAMPEAEFLNFASAFQFVGDSYGGIAPYRDYVRQPKYFGNDKKATHIVEFKTPSEGFLYVLFQRELGVHGNPKAEGGGTFGLGPTGNGQGRAGEIFNRLLKEGEINYRVVDWKDKNTLP